MDEGRLAPGGRPRAAAAATLGSMGNHTRETLLEPG